MVQKITQGTQHNSKPCIIQELQHTVSCQKFNNIVPKSKLDIANIIDTIISTKYKRDMPKRRISDLNLGFKIVMRVLAMLWNSFSAEALKDRDSCRRVQKAPKSKIWRTKDLSRLEEVWPHWPCLKSARFQITPLLWGNRDKRSFTKPCNNG